MTAASLVIRHAMRILTMSLNALHSCCFLQPSGGLISGSWYHAKEPSP